MQECSLQRRACGGKPYRSSLIPRDDIGAVSIRDHPTGLGHDLDKPQIAHYANIGTVRNSSHTSHTNYIDGIMRLKMPVMWSDVKTGAGFAADGNSRRSPVPFPSSWLTGPSSDENVTVDHCRPRHRFFDLLNVRAKSAA